MAFSLTEAQVLARTKTVTRRLRWLAAKPGMLLQPVRKGQGLRKGEGVVRLGYPIRVEDVRHERLNQITPEDVVREGFQDWTPEGMLLQDVCAADIVIEDDGIVWVHARPGGAAG